MAEDTKPTSRTQAQRSNEEDTPSAKEMASARAKAQREDDKDEVVTPPVEAQTGYDGTTPEQSKALAEEAKGAELPSEVAPPGQDQASVLNMTPDEIRNANLRVTHQDNAMTPNELPVTPISTRNPWTTPERSVEAGLVLRQDASEVTPTEKALRDLASAAPLLIERAEQERKAVEEKSKTVAQEVGGKVYARKNADGEADGHSAWLGEAYIGTYATAEEANEALKAAKEDPLHRGVMRHAAERAGRNH